MKSRTCVLLACCLLSLSILVTTAECADSSANEAAKELVAAPEDLAAAHPWHSSVNYAWLPDSHIRSSGGDVAMKELEAVFGRNFGISSKFSLSTDLAYSNLDLERPASARLPEELHTLSLKLTGNYQWDKDLALNFLLSPSLNGDFKAIGSEDVRTQLGFLARYNSSAATTLIAGIIYQQGNETLPVLPVLGIIYHPSDQWLFSLAAPRPGITYSPNRNSSYYITGEFSGKEYQLHDPPIGAKKISYRDYRASAGAEYTLFQAIKLDIAGGYAFGRKFVFYDSIRDDLRIENGPYVKVGVSAGW